MLLWLSLRFQQSLPYEAGFGLHSKGTCGSSYLRLQQVSDRTQCTQELCTCFTYESLFPIGVFNITRRIIEMVTTLNNLAANYFRKKGFKTESDVVMEGVSGIPRVFDLVVTKPNEQRVVQILSWKRTVGINIVINLDKASEDVGFTKPIVISEKFSSHAKAYANRKGLTLLTRQEISKYWQHR